MQELTVRKMKEMLKHFEDDSIVVIPCWDQEKKYGYNYATIESVVDECASFPNLNGQVKVLTRDGKIVSHLELRGEGRRFVVLQ